VILGAIRMNDASDTRSGSSGDAAAGLLGTRQSSPVLGKRKVHVSGLPRQPLERPPGMQGPSMRVAKSDLVAEIRRGRLQWVLSRTRTAGGWRMPDWLWARVERLLPAAPEHPWGCRNPRLPDRDAMDAILLVLRTGMQWNA
jgi:putative transposase of IS4/5 family DUF4096